MGVPSRLSMSHLPLIRLSALCSICDADAEKAVVCMPCSQSVVWSCTECYHIAILPLLKFSL